MQQTLPLGLPASCVAGLGCRWGAETRESFCPTISRSCSQLLAMGGGSRASCPG